MKILNTNLSQSNPFQNNDYSSLRSSKKKERKDEFKKLLDTFLNEQSDEVEEFKVHLPRHGHFWDNGYEDVG
jgi:hypothetical protein